MIYSVLLSGKMIIYILQSLDPPSQACLPLHTQNNPYISPGSRLSVWWWAGAELSSSLSPVWVRLFRNTNHVSLPVSDQPAVSQQSSSLSSENKEDWQGRTQTSLEVVTVTQTSLEVVTVTQTSLEVVTVTQTSLEVVTVNIISCKYPRSYSLDTTEWHIYDLPWLLHVIQQWHHDTFLSKQK